MALLLVFTKPGNNTTEPVFHDWYDNEHIPLRNAIPGFLSTIRLREINPAPEAAPWGAVYNLSSQAVIRDPAYLALLASQSDREKEIFKDMDILDRRVYVANNSSPIRISPLYNGELKEGSVVVFVSFEMALTDEEDVHRWYEDEHIGLLSQVPGWNRTRRFTLVESAVSGKQSPLPPSAKNWLAVHEFASPDFVQSNEWKKATSTPWRERVYTKVSAERRFMQVYKSS